MPALHGLSFRLQRMRTIIEFPDDQPDTIAYSAVLCLQRVSEDALQAIVSSNTQPKVVMRELPPALTERLLPFNIRFFVETALDAASHRALLPVRFQGKLVTLVMLFRDTDGRLSGITLGPLKEINKRTVSKFVGTEGQLLLERTYETLLNDDGPSDAMAISA